MTVCIDFTLYETTEIHTNSKGNQNCPVTSSPMDFFATSYHIKTIAISKQMSMFLDQYLLDFSPPTNFYFPVLQHAGGSTLRIRFVKQYKSPGPLFRSIWQKWGDCYSPWPWRQTNFSSVSCITLDLEIDQNLTAGGNDPRCDCFQQNLRCELKQTFIFRVSMSNFHKFEDSNGVCE